MGFFKIFPLKFKKMIKIKKSKKNVVVNMDMVRVSIARCSNNCKIKNKYVNFNLEIKTFCSKN